MKKLKPCPFCGGKDSYPVSNCGYWSVYCVVSGCNIFGPSKESEEKAKKAWNKRFKSLKSGEVK